MHQVFIGSDHAGFELKEKVKVYLQSKGFSVEDKGCNGPDSVDYPDFAESVASQVADNLKRTGILICGTGIGMSIAANKIHGIRAALVHDAFEARMSREHNNANILCIGARTLEPDTALNIVGVFLATEFEGDRHARRVNKIMALES